MLCWASNQNYSSFSQFYCFFVAPTSPAHPVEIKCICTHVVLLSIQKMRSQVYIWAYTSGSWDTLLGMGSIAKEGVGRRSKPYIKFKLSQWSVTCYFSLYAFLCGTFLTLEQFRCPTFPDVKVARFRLMNDSPDAVVSLFDFQDRIIWIICE